MMQVRWLDGRETYDGAQLAPHWILRTTGLVGDAVVGWRGPCRIRDEEMADLEDLLAGAVIAGDDMVHLLWESFDSRDLELATTRQRLLAALGGEWLLREVPEAGLHRTGDDLWVGERKLSISVAVVSGVSSLVHFAVNASPGGAPVPTVSLQELGVEPETFGRGLMESLAREIDGIRNARARVRFRDG